MELTPCPACGHAVSPRATACPQCGDPLTSSAATARPTTAPVVPSPGADQGTAKPATEKTSPIAGIVLVLLVVLAGGYFLWREHQAGLAKVEAAADQQSQRAAIEEDLKAAEERLEKLRAARLMEFAIYSSRQFEEAPHGKGMFDTKLIENGVPQRCVLVVKPSRMANHGLVTTTLKATKLTRSQFTMTITAQTGITSQQTDFYDVYEAVEQDDIGRLEVRILELKRQLASEP